MTLSMPKAEWVLRKRMITCPREQRIELAGYPACVSPLDVTGSEIRKNQNKESHDCTEPSAVESWFQLSVDVAEVAVKAIYFLRYGRPLQNKVE
jgi:hypothetical protein